MALSRAKMRKRQRTITLFLALLALGGAAGLGMTAFEDSIVFFFSPSDLKARGDIAADRRLRIGGLVAEGSVRAQGGGATSFVVTDMAENLTVTYVGILPDLFREGQGVVAEGYLLADGGFRAEEVLAKHDETYMPREVADSLRKTGHWRDTDAAAAY